MAFKFDPKKLFRKKPVKYNKPAGPAIKQYNRTAGPEPLAPPKAGDYGPAFPEHAQFGPTPHNSRQKPKGSYGPAHAEEKVYGPRRALPEGEKATGAYGPATPELHEYGPMPAPGKPRGSGAKPPVQQSYGPAHRIPEHPNPKGAHSVLEETGRGQRLWGSSVNNFQEAGGFARLGTSAVRGAMVGGVSGGIFEGATGGDFWEGAKSGAMYGGVGAAGRRGVRSMTGAKKGQSTLNAADKHMKTQYKEGWTSAAFNTVRQKEAAKATAAATVNKRKGG